MLRVTRLTRSRLTALHNLAGLQACSSISSLAPRNDVYAFTLAEVLITLGIIGIVAALTIPGLLAEHKRKVLHTQFLKVYSDLNQMSKKFQYDYGVSVPEYTSTQWQEFNNKIFISYFNGGRDANSWWYGDSDEKGETKPLPYDVFPIKGSAKAGNICDLSGYKTDIQGRSFMMNDAPYDAKNGPVICVDTNGPKLPNRYGQDFFLFVFTTDGYVIPMGMEHKDNKKNADYGGGNFSVEGSSYCTISDDYGKQFSCAKYALQNKHPFKSEKDYWNDFLSEAK